MAQQAWGDMGSKPLPGNDTNAGVNLDVGELNENRHNGERQIAPLTYLLDGVTVLTDSVVGSVLLSDRPDVKVTGVRLVDGTEYHGKQVILSAGAYRTPQVLMLLGLGPKETSDTHGLKTVVDSPEMGRNFTDHVMVRMNWKLKDPAKGYAIGSPNPLFAQPQFSKGMPISHIKPFGEPREELEAVIAKDAGGNAGLDHYLLKKEFAMMEAMVINFLMATKPTSRGTMTIASKDPADHPLLDPNYLATGVDTYVWRHSLRKMATLMAGDITVLGREVVAEEAALPGFDPLGPYASDEELDRRVQIQGVSTSHGAGSCSMGSVVDIDLMFKGINNLRIADAPVISIAIGAHIQAAVYALAEQRAAIIAKDTPPHAPYT
ncbi:Oxygen-dependent choline dehydrogenase [Apiospora kogelbergensis]|uniref:Oxygen-dependent choline dehydrogenase n=1 Tax=Apiospora kogelbergensis TaxID=1337665 RepID=A0AAW0QY63_9PEZI